MATLNINGQRITVDDGFLNLSPDQQEATVEEIAASLPKAAGGPAGASFAERFGSGPMARETQERFGDYAGVAADYEDPSLGRELTRRADERLIGEPGFGNMFMSTALNFGNILGMGLPTNAVAGAATAAGALGVEGFSPRFGQNFRLAQDQLAALSRQSPGGQALGVAGGIVGGLRLPMWQPMGAGTLAGRMVNSGVNVGGYSALSALADEGLHRATELDALGKMVLGGGLGVVGGAAVQPFLELGGRAAGRVANWLTSSPGTVPDVPANVFPKGVNPAAATEAQAERFGIDLTRGQATGDFGQQAYENVTARGGIGENAPPDARLLRDFLEQQEAQVAAAKGDIGRRLGGSADLVERPYDAAVAVAERARATQQLAETVAAGREAAAAREASGLAPADPLDAADTALSAVRSRAAAEKAGYQRAYEDVAAMPGRFQPGTFDRVGAEVRQAVEGDDVFVDPILTPAANRALLMLDELPTLRLGGVEPQPVGLLPNVGGKPQATAQPGVPAPPAARPVEGAAAAAPALGDSIVTPSGQRIGVEYRVVDAADLRTSHTPEFRPNPDYPADLQPRDRSRAAAERQVQEIASDLKPEWLGASPSAREGAPVVGPDGLVESGNGRVMGIRRAYAEGGESARRYREWLAGQGYETAGLKEPVLVRVRRSDLSPEDRVRFTQEANASAGLEMGAAERAASDAQRLPGRALELYTGGDVTEAGNRDLVRAFVASLPRGEEGSVTTKAGELSLAGAQRLRNALLHRAYGDANLVGSLAEVGDDSIRAFGRVLQDLAPAVAQLREGIGSGAVAAGADLSRPLLEAAQLVQAARARGLKLPEAVAQQDAFARLAPETDAVLRLVYGPDLTGRVNRERAVEALRGALADAGKQTEGAGLFGQGPLSAADILTAKAARGSTADAAPPVRGTGTPADPIRMSAADYRAMQAGDAPKSGVAPTSTPATQSGALDLRGVDQARKRLVAAYRAAKRSGNAEDMRAVSAITRAFDDRVERAMTDGLFSGNDAALEAMRNARAAFAQYQRTYRPQGAGDDVGRAMQRMVEREAQPQDVANYLYGSSLSGNKSGAMRLADRLKRILPEDAWKQVQQGYVGRVLGDATDHAKVIDRIQKALSGEGRGLTYRMLSDEQVAGLRSIQRGLQAARGAREAVPDWIGQLAKADFDPQAVVRNLFRKSTATGNAASASYARGVRDLVGPQSETWAAVRQAGWQQLVSKPEGSTADFGPQALANRISNFLEKDGRSLAQTLYSAEERETMRSFAGVMRTLTPKRLAGGSVSNGDTAPMLQRTLDALGRHETKINRLLAGIGLLKGGPGGAAAAYGMAKAAQGVASALQGQRALQRAQEAVSGAPVPVPPRPVLPVPNLPRYQGLFGGLVGGSL